MKVSSGNKRASSTAEVHSTHQRERWVMDFVKWLQFNNIWMPAVIKPMIIYGSNPESLYPHQRKKKKKRKNVRKEWQ